MEQEKENAVALIKSNAELVKKIPKTIKSLEDEIAELELQKAKVEKEHASTESKVSQFSDEIEKTLSRRDDIDVELKIIATEIELLEKDKNNKSDKLEASRSELERGKLANELKKIQSKMKKKIVLRDKIQKELVKIPLVAVSAEFRRVAKMKKAIKLEAELTEIAATIKQLLGEKQTNKTKLEKVIAENKGIPLGMSNLV